MSRSHHRTEIALQKLHHTMEEVSARFSALGDSMLDLQVAIGGFLGALSRMIEDEEGPLDD